MARERHRQLKEHERRVADAFEQYRRKWGIRWPIFFLASQGHNLREIEEQWSIPKVFAMLDAHMIGAAMKSSGAM